MSVFWVMLSVSIQFSCLAWELNGCISALYFALLPLWFILLFIEICTWAFAALPLGSRQFWVRFAFSCVLKKSLVVWNSVLKPDFVHLAVFHAFVANPGATCGWRLPNFVKNVLVLWLGTTLCSNIHGLETWSQNDNCYEIMFNVGIYLINMHILYLHMHIL